MNNHFKPENYNSVSPYLIVDGAQKMVDLLKLIFDAEELRRYDRPDGKIMHMELRLDDSIVMLADSTEIYKANNTLLHVYVPDVNATYSKAIHNGCTSIEAPVNKDGDPDKRSSFTDFAGNMWSVSTQSAE